MLRSLYSGISGLRAHQTMLDVTGNNIANVNTAGFKSSSVQFEDTLSQLTKGSAAPAAGTGGTNPAQVGLGVQVSGVSTNFNQGSAQATGKSTDMMISGDGFFAVKSGGQSLYTRSGAFNLDAAGRLVTPDGATLQGWSAVNGVVPTGGAVGDITLSSTALAPAKATTSATASGNLPAEQATGTTLNRQISVYDATGTTTALDLAFVRNGANWDVTGTDAAGNSATTTLSFNNGVLAAGGNMTVGTISVDLTKVTGYTGMNTVTLDGQDGRPAGTLQSFSIATDGTIMGSFSNGAKQAVGQIAMAKFTNPGGLEKAGNSEYRVSANSGNAVLGTAGAGGFGSVTAGSLEMSNVDLSQEFTNLIVAQRGFQANARIITTSDQVLQELVDLKR
jgi:flagellar hook protein FlgE